MVNILNQINDMIWGLPLIILILGTGIYFSYKLNFLQISKFILAFKYIFTKEEGISDDDGEVSSFAALCTALSSTVGTGNIVGVATAVVAGGPGALFWMSIAAFFGMATKYAEGFLAIKYRTKDDNGELIGGPMEYLSRGLGSKFLAKAFALFGVLVALMGIGTFTQVNSMTNALGNTFNVPVIISAIVITILVTVITLGGIKRIAKVAEIVIPFMVVFYVLGVGAILLVNITAIPAAIVYIIECAFNPSAIIGGGTGITMIMVMQKGIGRGIFSNEAGLGSAPIAAAAAKTNSPVRQGLISMTGTFLDTLVICSMTGLAIVLTGATSSGLNGAELTTHAFQKGFIFPEIGSLIVNVGLIFFAFTTVIGWNYYGERCITYLFGHKSILPYKIIFIICVALGPFMQLTTVFILADIFNGLMAFPNLVGLIGLRHVIIKETREYFGKLG